MLNHTRTLGGRLLAGAAAALVLAVALATTTAQRADAVALPVPLGTAGAFAVLGYSTVTNTGPSVISGDIGVNPGSAVVGFPPGSQIAGATYAAEAVGLQARNDASTAFTSASGQTGPVTVGVELGGTTLTPDLYESGGVFQVNGTLTLDALGDPAAIFVFRSLSTLITGSGSSVVLTGSANACNVFWIVPSSATLGTTTTFVGTIIATTSISANAGTSVDGRLLALNGAVTLDSTSVTSTGCSAATANPGTGTTADAAAATTTAAQAAADAAAAQAAADAAAAQAAADAAALLAATGVDDDLALWLACAFVVAGSIMVLTSRRRTLGATSVTEGALTAAYLLMARVARG